MGGLGAGLPSGFPAVGRDPQLLVFVGGGGGGGACPVGGTRTFVAVMLGEGVAEAGADCSRGCGVVVGGDDVDVEGCCACCCCCCCAC